MGTIKKSVQGPRHLWIPDTQLKLGVPMEHLEWAGAYAGLKQPQTIIIGGDWYDMPSLSSYDEGKLSSHGKRIADDLEAGRKGLELFENALKKHAPKGYNPRKIVVLGNHEERILRAIDANPKLEGTISMEDLAFKRYGWTVYPFLKPVTVDGVTYIHFCPLNAQGRVSASKFGAPSALAQARRMMRSTVCGHRQGLDTAIVHTPGRTVRGIIAGSFYQHEEKYLTACGDTYWRGLIILNDIHQGDFDLCEVSMSYLGRRFG